MYPDRMRANLEADGGLAFSQSVLLALVDAGLSRDDAYRIVQKAAADAWEREADFRAALGSNPEVQRLLTPRGAELALRSRAVPAQPRRRVREAREAPGRGGLTPPMGVTGELRSSGKVRDLYDAGPDRLLLVATDRISAFDVILPTPIPDKGRVLTGMSLLLVRAHRRPGRRTTSSRPDRGRRRLRRRPGGARHARAPRRRRAARVRRARLPRRAPAGRSTARRRRRVRRAACRRAWSESDRLPEPIFTPTTKAAEGHDLPLSPAEAADLVGRGLAERLKELTLDPLRARGRPSRWAAASSSPTRSSSSGSATAS